MVDIAGYSQLKFSHIQTTTHNTSLGYAFYDSAKKYITGKSNAGISYAPIDVVLDIPADAAYFRCMWINTTHASYNPAMHDIKLFYCLAGEGFSSAESGTGDDTDSPIPAHWLSHMTSKVAEINAIAAEYGTDADCFIFITDQHRPTGAGNDAILMNHIIENTPVSKIVFGGDIVQGSNSDETLFRAYRSELTSSPIILPIRGNHEAWGNCTESIFRDIWIAPLVNVDGCHTISDRLWFHYDDQTRKIRYIFTDSTYQSSDGTDNLTNDEQIAWMQERIIELPEDWTVLIFHHGIWTASKNSTMPINNDGQKMIDSIDQIYETSRCSIAGVYAGHCHRDYNTKTDKGYLLVGTTLDCCSSGQSSYDINYPVRTKNTITEHAFDVVFLNPTLKTIKTVRIGAGKNREFTW